MKSLEQIDAEMNRNALAVAEEKYAFGRTVACEYAKQVNKKFCELYAIAEKLDIYLQNHQQAMNDVVYKEMREMIDKL